jgi:hypothetical protein
MITTKNKFGLLHSYNDQPFIIDKNLYWYRSVLLYNNNEM